MIFYNLAPCVFCCLLEIVYAVFLYGAILCVGSVRWIIRYVPQFYGGFDLLSICAGICTWLLWKSRIRITTVAFQSPHSSSRRITNQPSSSPPRVPCVPATSPLKGANDAQTTRAAVASPKTPLNASAIPSSPIARGGMLDSSVGRESKPSHPTNLLCQARLVAAGSVSLSGLVSIP